MDEREPTQFEVDLAEILGKLSIGTARAIAALAEAVSKQPGIDREKLLDDWFNLIPKADQASEIDSMIYRSIDQLLATGHALPDQPHEK